MATRFTSDRTGVAIPLGELTTLRLGEHRDRRLLERFPGGEIHLSADDADDLMAWLDRRGQRTEGDAHDDL